MVRDSLPTLTLDVAPRSEALVQPAQWATITLALYALVLGVATSLTRWP